MIHNPTDKVSIVQKIITLQTRIVTLRMRFDRRFNINASSQFDQKRKVNICIEFRNEVWVQFVIKVIITDNIKIKGIRVVSLQGL